MVNEKKQQGQIGKVEKKRTDNEEWILIVVKEQ